MALPPKLSAEERQQALAKAAAARRERAEIKEKLKMGGLTLSQLLSLAETSNVIAKMKVLSVLESLPGVGKVKARKLLERFEISESRRIRGLGQKQREALLSEFG